MMQEQILRFEDDASNERTIWFFENERRRGCVWLPAGLRDWNYALHADPDEYGRPNGSLVHDIAPTRQEACDRLVDAFHRHFGNARPSIRQA